MNRLTKCADFFLELCALDNSMSPPAETTENPVWERVCTALENAFDNGGFVYLRVVGSGASFVKELCMRGGLKEQVQHLM